MNPHYITPRIAIAKITNTQDFETVSKQIQLRHKNYYHFFNLTTIKLPSDRQSSFKWRGNPFSVTQTFKVLTQIDAFLRINIANAAILCVSHPSIDEYARTIVKSYVDLCFLSSKASDQTTNKKESLTKLGNTIINNHEYFLKEMQQIYKNISISNPPIKMLEWLTVSPENLFIPIIQIFNESRYNDFQSIYYHSVEEELAVYYLNLDRPLQTGIGKKYYDNKPQTKYFSKPIGVFGDVKIVVYSYKTLKKVYQFTIGFNTLNIDFLNSSHPQVLTLEESDLYDKAEGSKPQKIKIQVGYSDYCDNKKCKERADCNDCRDMQKKLSNRYSEVQQDLSKLHRGRTIAQISTLLSI